MGGTRVTPEAHSHQEGMLQSGWQVLGSEAFTPPLGVDVLSIGPDDLWQRRRRRAVRSARDTRRDTRHAARHVGSKDRSRVRGEGVRRR